MFVCFFVVVVYFKLTRHCSCVTGALTPDQGHLEVYGKAPHDAGSEVPGRTIGNGPFYTGNMEFHPRPLLGFMPQETALFPEFTVNEVLVRTSVYI